MSDLRNGDSQTERGYTIVCVDDHGVFHVHDQQTGRVIKRYTADTWEAVWGRLDDDLTSGRI